MLHAPAVVTAGVVLVWTDAPDLRIGGALIADDVLVGKARQETIESATDGPAALRC